MPINSEVMDRLNASARKWQRLKEVTEEDVTELTDKVAADFPDVPRADVLETVEHFLGYEEGLEEESSMKRVGSLQLDDLTKGDRIEIPEHPYRWTVERRLSPQTWLVYAYDVEGPEEGKVYRLLTSEDPATAFEKYKKFIPDRKNVSVVEDSGVLEEVVIPFVEGIEKVSRFGLASRLTFTATPETKDVDETGHHKITGLPVWETKPVEIGLTEFPAGQERGKDEGYRIPFKDMDETQVKGREVDDNIRFQRWQNMTRDEIERLISGKDYPLTDFLSGNKQDLLEELIREDKVPPGSQKRLTSLAQEQGETVTTPLEPKRLQPVLKRLKVRPPGIPAQELEAVPELPERLQSLFTSIQTTLDRIDQLKAQGEDIVKQAREQVKALETEAGVEDLKRQLTAFTEQLDQGLAELDQQAKFVYRKFGTVFTVLHRKVDEGVAVPSDAARLEYIFQELHTLDAELSRKLKNKLAYWSKTNTVITKVLQDIITLYPAPKTGALVMVATVLDSLQALFEGLQHSLGDFLQDLSSVNDSLDTLLVDVTQG